MMKKLTKQQIIDWALGRGWRLDKWGHLQKLVNGKQYRLKLSSIAVRNEVKGHSGWIRLRSGYLKGLSFDTEGKLCGLK